MVFKIQNKAASVIEKKEVSVTKDWDPASASLSKAFEEQKLKFEIECREKARARRMHNLSRFVKSTTAPDYKLTDAAALPPTQPVITDLPITEGQTGDLVVINGTGFGMLTKVFFRMRPDKVLEAPIESYTPTQILCSVPDVYLDDYRYSNLWVAEPTNVLVYAETRGMQSSFIPFRFKPTLELAILLGNDDRAHWRLQGPKKHKLDGLLPQSGNDVFYENKLLGNNFVMCAAGLEVDHYRCLGIYSADVIETRIGTNSPFVKVHWSLGWGHNTSAGGYRRDFLASNNPKLYYYLTITVKGPKGIDPDFIEP